jgi:hypothetical protein
LINFDYIGLGLLEPLLSRGANLALFGLWLLFDFLLSATNSFHLPISDLIRALPSTPYLSFGILFAVTLPILLIVILLVRLASLFKSPRCLRTTFWGSILLLAILPTDLISASGHSVSLLGTPTGQFSGSTLWRSAYITALDFQKSTLDRQDFWKIGSATKEAEQTLSRSSALLPSKVVVVLLETGRFRNTIGLKIALLLCYCLSRFEPAIWSGREQFRFRAARCPQSSESCAGFAPGSVNQGWTAKR